MSECGFRVPRRLLLKAVTLASAVGYPYADAQQFPFGPIRFIVPASPGTVLDLIARFIAEPLGKRLSTTVLVETKVGANGIIGTNFVAKSPPDGHVLLFTSASLYTNQWISETPLPYDPVKDFVPVVRLATSALIVLVPANSPYRNLMDLVRDMKSRPAEIAYSSAGVGSPTHLCSVALNSMTGTKARHIPYKGAAGAVTDVAGGQVAFTCQSPSMAMALVSAGRLRALAVTGARRIDALADVPTVAQAGVPGFDLSASVGVMAPAATPAAVVRELSSEITRIAATPAFKQFCSTQSISVDIADSATFAVEGMKEADRWRQIIELSKRS